MYFHYFVLIFPWKDSGAHNLKKIKSSSPKDAKFALNWAIGSGEEDFYTLLIYFHYLLIISP